MGRPTSANRLGRCGDDHHASLCLQAERCAAPPSPSSLSCFSVCHSNSSHDSPRRHAAVHPSELARAHSPTNHARTRRVHPRHLSEEHTGAEKTRQPLTAYENSQAFTHNREVCGQNISREKDKKPTEARAVHCTPPKRVDARRPRRHLEQQRCLWLRAISRCLLVPPPPSLFTNRNV